MRIITVIFSIFLFFADLIALGLVIAIFPGVVEKYKSKYFFWVKGEVDDIGEVFVLILEISRYQWSISPMIS